MCVVFPFCRVTFREFSHHEHSLLIDVACYECRNIMIFVRVPQRTSLCGLLKTTRLLFLLRIVCPAAASSMDSGAHAYSIEHVSVISMSSPEILIDQTVVVAGNRILRFGPSSLIRVPANAQRIDGRGKYLLPGLADMHVHLQSPVDLSLFLASGVTTVFDLNGKPAYLRWRDQIRKHQLTGPQLFLCGPYYRDPEAIPHAIARVDQIADDGYDVIKIKNNVTAEEFDAIVREAKAKRLLILGHYPRKVEWQHVLDSGVNLAHEEEVLYGAFSPDGVYGNVEHGSQKVNAVVQEIAASRTFLISKLSMYKAISEQATAFDQFSKHTLKCSTCLLGKKNGSYRKIPTRMDLCLISRNSRRTCPSWRAC